MCVYISKFIYRFLQMLDHKLLHLPCRKILFLQKLSHSHYKSKGRFGLRSEQEPILKQSKNFCPDKSLSMGRSIKLHVHL